jgi:hypothetical protein
MQVTVRSINLALLAVSAIAFPNGRPLQSFVCKPPLAYEGVAWNNQNAFPSRGQPTATSSSAIYARNLRKTSPGSELFPDANSSYVPSGLTKEDWDKIQQKENKEQKSKDFGAWGPKFAKSDRPNGDWMVLSGLWTGGFDSNKNGLLGRTAQNGDSNVEQGSSGSRVLRTLPVYTFTYLLIELLFTASYSFHKKEAASLIMTVALKMKRSAAVASISSSMMKMSGLKCLLSLALTKPVETMVVKFMNKFQCSFKTALAYCTAMAVGSISVAFALQKYVL